MKILLILVIALVLFRIYFILLEQKGLYHPTKEIPEMPDKTPPLIGIGGSIPMDKTPPLKGIGGSIPMDNLGIAYKEVNFKTSDGETLNGWYIPAKDAKVTILYCHGNAGNIYHRLHRVKFFYEMGVNFFVFDYRGYGKSSGRPGEKGLYNDAAAAYDYLISRNDINKSKIVMYGKSLGGAVAVEVCLRRKVSALILESSFASVAIRAQQMYPFLPMKFLITQKYDTVAKIKNVRVPKLILHGRNDEVISFRHGQIIFEVAAGPKQFLPFEGGHNDDIYVTSPVYKEKLHKFLAENSVLQSK